MEAPEGSKTERGSEGPGLAMHVSWSPYLYLAGIGGFGYVNVVFVVFSRCLGKDTKMPFHCYSIFNAIKLCIDAGFILAV